MKTDNIHFPGMLGGISVVGIGLIARGAMLLRGTRRVIVDGHGVVIEGFIAQRRVAWTDIGSVQRDKVSGPFDWGKTRRVINLVAPDKKKMLATIDQSVEPFDQLAAEIEERSSAATGRATVDPAAQRELETRRASKQRRLLLILVTPMAVIFALIFGMGINEALHTRRFASEGVTVEARVIKRQMKSVTPYVEYEFADAAGKSFRREMMVTTPTYDSLALRPTITVEYLRSDPDWNRPTGGFESAETSFGGPFLFLSGGGTLVLLAMDVLAFMGFDLKTEDGKTRIYRHGRPIGRAAEEKQAAGAFPPIAVTAPMPVIAHVPPAQSKPVGLIALGVIAIVFGILGVALGAGRLALTRVGRIEFPSGRVLEFDSSAWRVAWVMVDAVLALMLMVAGIGLVRVRRWGRTMGIAVAALQLASTVGAIVVVIFMMTREPTMGGQEGVRQSAYHVAGILGALLSGVFPLVMLLVLRRASTNQVWN